MGGWKTKPIVFSIAIDSWDKGSFGELKASIVPAQHPPSALGLLRVSIPAWFPESQNASSAHKLISVSAPGECM